MKFKSYLLRGIPEPMWEQFKKRAQGEGHSIREKILRMIEEEIEENTRKKSQGGGR